MKISNIMGSLRVRLVLILLCAILPMVALVCYNDITSREESILEKQRYLHDLIRNCETDYRHTIGQTRQLLAALANFPAVLNLEAGECSGFFAKILKENPIYLNIIAAKPNGEVFASGMPLPKPDIHHLTDRLYFRRIQETKKFSMGELALGLATGIPTLPGGYPVLDSAGKIQAVVAAGLNLAHLSSIFQITELPADASVVIIDSKGRLMFRRLKQDKYIGQNVSRVDIVKTVLSWKQGMATARGIDGQEKLYAFMPLGGAIEKAFIYAGFPTRIIYEKADSTLIRNLLLLLSISLASLVMAQFLGYHFIMRRREDLLDALPAMVFLKTPGYSIRFANRLFRETYWNPEGKRCYEAFAGNEPCRECSSLKVLDTGLPCKEEWQRANGKKIYEFSHHPFVDLDGSRLVLTLGTDITKRKRLEEALRQGEDRLRHLTGQLLTIQEEERERIARELHDELGQFLLAMKMHAGAIRRQAAAGEDTDSEWAGFLENLNSMLERIRHIAFDLSPYILTDLGLEAALQRLLMDFSKYRQIGLKISGDFTGLDHAFPPADQIHIYRIFQECLTNAGKHAEADSLQISVTWDGKEVSFRLADNGRGFDPAAVMGSASKGIGLATLQERTRLLGGELSISSAPGEGTRINLVLPVRAEK